MRLFRKAPVSYSNCSMPSAQKFDIVECLEIITELYKGSSSPNLQVDNEKKKKTQHGVKPKEENNLLSLLAPTFFSFSEIRDN